MSDKLPAKKSSGKHLAPVLLFGILGFAIHTVFFIGALICLVFNMPTRNQKIAMALLGGFFVIAAFGYGIGKDMAVRDNHASATSRDKAP